MNTKALGNDLELEPVRRRKVSSILNIDWFCLFGFVQLI